GRHRPDREGIRPPGWELHPLRRERGRPDQQPGQPARHPDLRPRRARAARPQLHEDRLARPGGAVMAASLPRRKVTKVPEIRRGDTVIVLTGKDAGKRGKVERIVRDPQGLKKTRTKYGSRLDRMSPLVTTAVVVEGINI